MRRHHAVDCPRLWKQSCCYGCCFYQRSQW